MVTPDEEKESMDADRSSTLIIPDWVTKLPEGRALDPTVAKWGSSTTTVATYSATFEAIYPKRTAAEWRANWPIEYGKPQLLDPEGNATVGEFEIIRALREAGWQAVWTDAFGSAPPWMHPWKSLRWAARVAEAIAQARRADPRAKPWDVLAWLGDDYRIVEFKGETEKLTEGELRLLSVMVASGVPMSTFAIVRGRIDFPTR